MKAVELELKPLFGIGRVTEQGVYFIDRYYSCSRAISDRWFELASEIGPWPVVVLYDPGSIETIFIVCHGESVLYFGELIKSEQPSKQSKYIQSIQDRSKHRYLSQRNLRTRARKSL
jgi:hypothetical protein